MRSVDIDGRLMKEVSRREPREVMLYLLALALSWGGKVTYAALEDAALEELKMEPGEVSRRLSALEEAGLVIRNGSMLKIPAADNTPLNSKGFSKVQIRPEFWTTTRNLSPEARLIYIILTATSKKGSISLDKLEYTTQTLGPTATTALKELKTNNLIQTTKSSARLTAYHTLRPRKNFKGLRLTPYPTDQSHRNNTHSVQIGLTPISKDHFDRNKTHSVEIGLHSTPTDQSDRNAAPKACLYPVSTDQFDRNIMHSVPIGLLPKATDQFDRNSIHSVQIGLRAASTDQFDRNGVDSVEIGLTKPVLDIPGSGGGWAGVHGVLGAGAVREEGKSVRSQEDLGGDFWGCGVFAARDGENIHTNSSFFTSFPCTVTGTQHCTGTELYAGTKLSTGKEHTISAREEKTDEKRDDNVPSVPPRVGTKVAVRFRDAVVFDWDRGEFVVQEFVLERWRSLYDQVDVTLELKKAAEWFVANLTRSTKVRNHYRFLVNWLNKAQSWALERKAGRREQNERTVKLFGLEPSKWEELAERAIEQLVQASLKRERELSTLFAQDSHSPQGVRPVQIRAGNREWTTGGEAETTVPEDLGQGCRTQSPEVHQAPGRGREVEQRTRRSSPGRRDADDGRRRTDPTGTERRNMDAPDGLFSRAGPLGKKAESPRSVRSLVSELLAQCLWSRARCEKH